MAILRGFWKQLWITLVVGLVMLALFSSIGRIVAPLLELYQDDIQQAISTNIQQPVHIKKLSAHWVGLSPVITLEGLALGGDQGIHLDRFEAKLNISASLFYRQPIFKSLVVEGIKADIQKLSDGRWQLAPEWIITVAADTEAPAEAVDITAFTHWLELQPSIYLDAIDLSFGIGGITYYAYLESLQWRSSGWDRELRADIAFGEEHLGKMKVKGFIEGELWPWNAQNGYISLQAVEQEWSPWLQRAFSEDKVKVEQLRAALDGWLVIHQGGLFATHVSLDLAGLLANINGQPFQQHQGRLEIAGQQQEGDWHLLLKPEFLDPLPISGISLSQYQLAQQKAWALQAEQASLAPLRKFLEHYQLLPAMAHDYLQGTAASGLVRDAQVVFLRDTESQQWTVDVKAQVEHLSSQGFHGIPAINGLEAKVHLQPLAGKVEVSDKEFNLHLNDLYAKPWSLADVQAQFSWRVYQDYVRLALHDSRATLLQDDTQQPWPLALDLNILLPLPKGLQEPQLSLLIGLPAAEVSLYPQLLPTIAGDAIEDWLSTALHAGAIENGVFALQSYLGERAPRNSQTIALNLDFQQAQLSYLPEWPRIEQAAGRLQMDLPSLLVTVQQAQTLGGALVQPSAQVRLYPQGAETVLDVRAHLAGEASEALSYLQHTPLQEVVQGAFDQWQASGQHRTELNFTMPLAEAAVPKVAIHTQLQQVDLTLNELQLTVEQITGPLSFSTETGVQAQGLQAQLFSGPMRANIDSQFVEERMELSLSGEGQAQVAAFKAWQPLFLLDPIRGDLNYQAQLQVRPGQSMQPLVQLDLTSDLQGTEVQLPSPFGKAAEDNGHLTVALKVAEDMQLQTNYQQLADIQLQFEQQNLARGQVRLGGNAAQLPTEPRLEVRGQISQPIDAQQWWATWQTLQALMPAATTPASSTPSSPQAELALVELKLNDIDAWGIAMGAALVGGERTDNTWNFEFTNQVVSGTLQWPDAGPMTLHLPFVHLPETPEPLAESTTFSDPMGDLDARDFPAVNAQIEEVFIGGREYGQWRLSGQPVAKGYQLDIDEGVLYGANLLGSVLWSMEPEMRTSLQDFRLTSKDVGKIQRGFRMQPFIEAKKMETDIAVSWQGSPLAFAMARLQGDVAVDIRNGTLVTDEADALKAFGILNIGSLSRRLKLDFSDLYSSGMAVDKLTTVLNFNDGEITLKEPAALSGPSGKFVTTGRTNLVTEELDMRMVVTLPVTGNLPLIAVLAGLAPPVAASIYVTEKLVGDELSRFTSASYDIKGTWSQPEMNIRRAFDNKVEGSSRRSLTDRIKGVFGRGGN